MQFIIDSLLLLISVMFWLALGQIIWERISGKAESTQHDTDIGISVLTHRMMHEDRISSTNDQNITSTYVPVVQESPAVSKAVIAAATIVLCIALPYWGKMAAEAYRYSSHVERLCAPTSPTTYGYTSGVWSDHPYLIEDFGPEVSAEERSINGRELCGH